MNTPVKSKLYVLIIGLLLLSNIILLFFFFGNKNENRHGGRGDRHVMIKNFLEKEIGFNPSQLTQFDSLRLPHKEKMSVLLEAFKKNKEEQLKELGKAGFSDSAITNTIEKSMESQKQMDLVKLQHIATIRKICTMEQLPKFDSLFYKIWGNRGNKNLNKNK